jgi:quercetin dioxygenase-like cupin family protein
MSDLSDISSVEPLAIWKAVRARRVVGERITLAIVELDPDAVVPEHRHPNEQVGICLRGSGRFRVGDEVLDMKPGSTWRILADVPHELTVGPQGAVVIDVFSPPRADWDAMPVAEPRPLMWPTAADEGSS